MNDFAEALKRHLISWAGTNGLAKQMESGRGRPWVLAEEHRSRNLFRAEW
jgi:hypothetical protein